jgi:predicted CoA-binding protein
VATDDRVDGLAILRATRTILLIDYPGRVVPDTLARAGFDVVAHEGPGPDEYRRYTAHPDTGDVTRSEGGPAPGHADLVFSYRPVAELPGIVEEARRIGATAVWLHQDGANGDELPESRQIVADAGLVSIAEPFILDAVSSLRSPSP